MQTYAQNSILIVKEITKLMLLTTSILILINIRLKLTVQLKLLKVNGRNMTTSRSPSDCYSLTSVAVSLQPKSPRKSILGKISRC